MEEKLLKSVTDLKKVELSHKIELRSVENKRNKEITLIK